MSRPTILRSAALLAAAVALVGCGETASDTTIARATLIDRRTDALSSDEIDYVNGTYSNCTDRSGDFSLIVAGNPQVDHEELSVLKGDTACTLSITAVHSGRDGLLSADAPISLGTRFGVARAFGTPAKYFVSGLLNSARFDDDFSLTLRFADDPRTADSTPGRELVTSATVSATHVASPNYTLDLGGVAVTTDLKRVTADVSGNLTLKAGSQPGDFYVLVAGELNDTYAAIDAAYDAGTKVAMAGSIPASSLLAHGVDLTGNAVRSVIIAKSTNGVTSYQKFAITFRPPVAAALACDASPDVGASCR